jgi:tetratricopeptide (TPR) repeat protein
MQNLKKNTSKIFLAALLIAQLGPLSSKGLCAGSQDETIAQLENQLFFHTYDEKDTLWRLDHIEKQAFGQALGGAVDERLSRLAQALPQTKTVAPQAIPATVANNSPTATTSATPDEQDCSIQRAHISIAAAAEEHATKFMAEGVKLFREGKTLDARAQFEQALALCPNNAEAAFSIGIIDEASGSLAEALSSYHKALKASPDRADYQQAIEQVEKKLAKNPCMDSRRVQIRGLAEDALKAYTEGRYQDALNLYLTLDEKAPNQALIKYNIGTIYLLFKWPEQALPYMKQANDLDPADARYVRAYRRTSEACSAQKYLANRDAKARPQWQTDLQDQMQAAKVQSQKPVILASGVLSSAPPPSDQNFMAKYGILGQQSNKGIVITTIGLASLASRALLQEGDIIRAVDGTVIQKPNELNEILSRKSPGEKTSLIIERRKNLSQISLQL